MKTTRRTFFGATGGTAALLFYPTRARGQATPATALPTPSGSPTPAITPTPTSKPDGLALLAREKYGKFLTEEELKMLDEKLAGMERRSGRLRGYRLQNSEEPVTDFHTVRR